jgi:hypothetical protein
MRAGHRLPTENLLHGVEELLAQNRSMNARIALAGFLDPDQPHVEGIVKHCGDAIQGNLIALPISQATAKHLLYQSRLGYIPEWNTYPGMHIPVPVRINTDRATDLIRAANEVLSLARMNWNTAFDTTGAPITLRFARQVGGIMAEAGQSKPNPSYRFYM